HRSDLIELVAQISRSQNSMPVFFYPPITGDSSVRGAGFRNLALGLRRKMRKAAMDRNYLASVLSGCGLS
ncbi:hypothetical protein KVP97_22885, partial [Escherichia coli]|nr:hypothetical protein [Escherichia coli]